MPDGSERKIHRTPSASSASQWAPLRRFVEREELLGLWAKRNGRPAQFAYEFVRFGIKQGWACLFGGLMLCLLMATHFWYPQGVRLARYDFLVIGAIGIQAAMLLSRLETVEEAKVIVAFHLVGTAMEIFKVSAGSWSYPEPGLLRVYGVPLFSGFMYAAVGSYLARVWRLFDFEFTRHPPLWAVSLLALAAYFNFFAHHYGPDMRLALFGAAALLFGRTWIYYRIWRRHRSMPLLLGLFLVAAFIWFAENIGTFAHAWTYPNQRAEWALVPANKLGAWFLLMLISYALVAMTHGIRKHRATIAESTAIRAPALSGFNAEARMEHRSDG
jgi:uncharacterized membrane protein YoaT (DUF817 family)